MQIQLKLKSESNATAATHKLAFYAKHWHDKGQIKKSVIDEALVEYMINAKQAELLTLKESHFVGDIAQNIEAFTGNSFKYPLEESDENSEYLNSFGFTVKQFNLAHKILMP